VIQFPNPYGPPTAYTTRILVRRPADPVRFNGTVLVEWLNVTEGADLDVDWAEGHREILRGGYAYVAVSAQQAGVNALKRWDDIRYGSLNHPGDTYADSIYAQILAAVRYGNGVNPLAGLQVRHVIADGHSQSGINLHAYVDHVQPRLPLADGFLIRGDVITEFDWPKLRTPVLQYQSEAEIDGPIGVGLQQPNHYVQPVAPAADSGYYRLWQVAGAAHIDKWGNDYTLHIRQRDDFAQPVTWDENAEGSYDGSGNPDCPSSLGLGPSDKFPQQYTLDAAVHVLNAWVSTGQLPASAPRMAVDSSGAPVRDQYGNAVGGVRDPAVDSPVATYHGDEGCPLVGTTRGLDAATLSKLYPSRADYVTAIQAAAARAQRNGWLLNYDASDLLAQARTAAGPPSSSGSTPSHASAFAERETNASAGGALGLPNTSVVAQTSSVSLVIAPGVIAMAALRARRRRGDLRHRRRIAARPSMRNPVRLLDRRVAGDRRDLS
jgi:hypothetical protein